MKINPMDKIRYDILSKSLKLFRLKGWFEKLNSSNIIVFDSEKQQFGLTITSKGERDNYGVTFFDGLNGIDCLNDMLTLSREQLNEASFNAIVISFKNEKELSSLEIDFFKKRKIRIKAKDNLTFLTYKEGYAPYFSTIKEANVLISGLTLFYSVFKDCEEEALEKFKDKTIQSMLCYVDIDAHEYSLSYGMLPTILKEPKFKKVLDYEVDMFKDIPQKDYEMKLITEHMNVCVSIDECNKAITPLLISTSNKELCDFSYFISLKKDQIEQMLFFLKENFEKNGLPTKIVFKQPFFYNAFYNLFKQLNIECVLDKTLVCGMFKVIDEAFNKTFQTIFIDQNFRTIDISLCQTSLDTLQKAVRSINNSDDCEIHSDMTFLCDNFFTTLFENKQKNDEEDDEMLEYTKLSDEKLVS